MVIHVVTAKTFRSIWTQSSIKETALFNTSARIKDAFRDLRERTIEADMHGTVHIGAAAISPTRRGVSDDTSQIRYSSLTQLELHRYSLLSRLHETWHSQHRGLSRAMSRYVLVFAVKGKRRNRKVFDTWVGDNLGVKSHKEKAERGAKGKGGRAKASRRKGSILCAEYHMLRFECFT